MEKIIIINTGSSNILSLKRAVEEFNKNVIVSDDPQTILSAHKIFFPGVGAFKKVMEYIEKKKLNETIERVKEKKIPLFGICLGHQILSLALGAKTKKMQLGHRGANHPVKDLTTSKVEITSQNHGFEVDSNSIPSSITITHKSLFDGSIEGIEVKGKKLFSVQYHLSLIHI